MADDVPRLTSKEKQMKGERVKKGLSTLGQHSLFRCSTDAMKRSGVSGFKFGQAFIQLYESQVAVAPPTLSCLERVSAYRKWATTIQTAHGPFPTRRDCTGESTQ